MSIWPPSSRNSRLCTLRNRSGPKPSPCFRNPLRFSRRNTVRTTSTLFPVIESLANAYKEQEKFDKAEPLYLARSSDPRKHSRPFASGYAGALDNLAALYAKQKRFADSAPFYERALQIRTTTLGPEHQLVTNNLDKLASVYTAQEKLVEAEPLYKQSFSIREKETLTALRSLASLYVAREKFAEADPLYKLALAIFDKDTPSEEAVKEGAVERAASSAAAARDSR